LLPLVASVKRENGSRVTYTNWLCQFSKIQRKLTIGIKIANMLPTGVSFKEMFQWLPKSFNQLLRLRYSSWYAVHLGGNANCLSLSVLLVHGTVI
jgi:hypothetical protein